MQEDYKLMAATRVFPSTENPVDVNLKRYVACLHSQMTQAPRRTDSSSQSKPARQLELPHQDSDRVEQFMSRYAFSKR
jgi:hypothetical protein